MVNAMTTHPSIPLPLWRRAAAELLGTAALVAVVVGSGIAAQRLSPNDAGLQLLENGIATALGLALLIALLQPVSGAHLNPVVTLAERALGQARPLGERAVYVFAQTLGGIGGAVLGNAMFEVPTAIATTGRLSPGTLLGEAVATAGLVLVVFGLARSGRPTLTAPAVGAYLGAAYWFTSSTAFANPAATIGRILTDTFAGIAPGSALGFLAAQLLGAATGLGLVLLLFPDRKASI